MHDPSMISRHRGVVRPEWIDYNGHMNVAYYLLAFDQAVDSFFESLGIDESYRKTARGGTYAAECHVTYQRELFAGDPLSITAQLIGYDEKRIHFIQTMAHEEKEYVAATGEWLSLHVHLDRRRVSPMPKPILDRLGEIYAVHRHLPRPPQVGRAIGLSRQA